MNTAKKSVIAIALGASLTLAACGSEEDAAAGSTTVTSATAAAPSGEGSAQDAEKKAAAASSAPASEDAEPKPQPSGEADNPPAAPPAGGEQTPQTMANPFEGQPASPGSSEGQPLEGGQQADQATIDALMAVSQGLYATTTLREFSEYVPAHTCQRVLDAQEEDLRTYDYNSIPDIPLDSLGVNWSQTNVESLNDVRVDGDVASATVVVASGGGQETSTMRFEREGGEWKFCQ